MTAYAGLSDDSLFKRMAEGDEAAFAALYHRRQGGIFRFALQMSGSAEMAEDVTQETFLALMRDARRFDPSRGSITAYLYGIARNQVLKKAEKDRHFVPIVDDCEEGDGIVANTLVSVSDPLGDLAQSQMISSVRQAVLSLPAHYREVVVLCDLQELCYAEAASVLGCAVGTVRSRLHRARAMLVGKLSGREETADAGAAATMRCFA